MQRKTRLDTQTTQTPQLSGVDTSGVKKTNDVLATQKTTKLGSQPVAGLDGKTKTIADIVTPQPATMLEKQAQSNPQNAWNSANTNYQAPETPQAPATQKPQEQTTTDITYSQDKTPYTPENIVSKAEQYQGQDGSLYQTVRNNDNTLTTIDVKTGHPVTGKYTDAERESIKQSFIGQAKPTSQDYYSQLQSGATIPPEQKKTTDYKIAENRKSNLDKFSNMSASDIAYSIGQGQFLPGTQVYNDLKAQNPQLVADAETLYQTNSKNAGKVMTPDDTLTAISSYLTKLMTPQETQTYAGILSQNTEITSLKNSLSETAKKLSDIKDQLEYSEEDLRKDFGGKTVTKGYMNAKNSERTRELGRLYNLTLAEYNTTAGQIQSISEDIKYEMAQKQEQEATNLTRFQAGFNMLQTLPGDINSTDPFLQQKGIENAVNQLYAQYPIPGMESPTLKIEKVKSMIAQGMTPQQAIQQLEQEIRNSDRYKNYINAYNSSLQPKATSPYELKEVGGVTYKFNQETGDYEALNTTGTGLGDLRGLANQFPGQAWAKNNNPAGITWNANFDNPTPGSTAQRLIDAGIKYSKGTSRPANEGGNYVTFDTIEDGLKAQRIMMQGTYGDSTVGQMLQKWVGTSEGPSYAKQVAGNAGIDLNVKVSSLSDIELQQLQSAKIQKESPGLYTLLQEANNNYGTEQQIYDAIFQGSGGASKVSEAESKTMKARAKEFASQGLTPQNALLKYKGLNVGQENEDTALEYINIGDNLTKKPSNYEMTVAKYLNNGDTKGLNTYVNRLVDQDVSSLYKTDAILSGDFEVGKNRVNEITSLISRNKDKVGAFDGRVNDLIQKFANTPDYQKIKTLLQMSQADMRKYFAGSAVTETEMKALQDFIGGTTKMNADNLVTMLNTLMQDRESVYNGQRAGMIPSSQTQGQVLYKDPNDGIEYTKESLIKEIETQITNGTATEQEVLNWLEKNNLSYILD